MRYGLVFDLDGTLLDTLQDLTDATNFALAEFGCPPRTTAEIRSFLGNGAQNQIRLALPGKPGDPDLQAVLATYKAYYNTHCQIKTEPYDGILQALKALNYPIAIVSNKPDLTAQAVCKAFFPGIYVRGETAEYPRKPAPDLIFRAMADLKVEKCVVIGDSEVDVAAAKNAGMPCLSVLWGFRDRKELEQNGATYFCTTPSDLPACIERILKETENGK